MRCIFRCICPDTKSIEEGPELDLPGLEAVRMAALRLAIDLRDRQGPVRWRGWTIEASDETGQTVLTMAVAPKCADWALALAS